MDATDGLVKIYIDLPDNEVSSSESFWAKPVGPDLYEMHNSPFHAYDLHFGDIVRAVPDSADLKPRIREVVKASGHKTLRVIFRKGTSLSRQSELLDQLKPLGASFERAWPHMVAVDVEPKGNYPGVCDQLCQWEREGLLDYDTETR